VISLSSSQTAESEGSFMQLDQLLSKSEFPTALLGPNGAIGAASAYTLCDKRDGWNEPVVRLSDDKVLAWLRAKVERMRHEFKKVPSLAHHYSPAEREETPEQEKERLGQQRREREEAEAKSKADSEDAMEEKKEGDSADAAASSSAAAISPSPATSSTSSTDRAPASSSLKMSLQFLSSYVTPGTFLRLLASYSLAYDDVFEKKRAAAAARAWESTGSGKISGDVDIARGSSSSAAANSDDKKRKAEKISVTAKKLATAAKGTKSLASFFGAAPKKAPTA
jgi:hypothetical protein